MSQPAGFASQPYEGIATFGRRPNSRDLANVNVAIVGVPYDGSTSYRSGTRLGPRAIREQSLLLWGYNNVQKVAPFESLSIVDYGDVRVVPVDILATHRAIEAEVAPIVEAGVIPIALGGDHSIALPLLRAQQRRQPRPAVVHFDAHPDTWDSEFGDCKYSHGTPFRRAIDEGLIDTSAYWQIGIRGPTGGPNDYADALALGAQMLTFEDVMSRGVAATLEDLHASIGDRPVYVSLDIDVVDPAYAPGTGTPEVGGFTSYQMLQLVRGLRGFNLVGFDLVEVSPPFDPAQITAVLAANLVFEFLSLLAVGKQ